MHIALGADHNGFRLKEALKQHLRDQGHAVLDVGCDHEAPIDYPDIAVQASAQVTSGRCERAILVCGTGIGMAIAANEVAGIRAASVADPYSAERASKSNDAQVLCLGARVVGEDVALILVDHWLASEFAGGASAQKVEKLRALDERPSTQP